MKKKRSIRMHTYHGIVKSIAHDVGYHGIIEAIRMEVRARKERDDMPEVMDALEPILTKCIKGILAGTKGTKRDDTPA